MKDEKLIREEERAKVILRVIENWEGIGETNWDKKVLENIDFTDNYIMCPFLDSLMDNATYDGYEGSRLKIKEKSINILENYREYINETLQRSY